jgi:hypothetical protein
MTKKRVGPAPRRPAKKSAKAKAAAGRKPAKAISAVAPARAPTPARAQAHAPARAPRREASRPRRQISFKADAWYARAVQRFGIRTGGAPAVDHSDQHVL